jgi:putative tricarboxylic transport membrane protein
MRISVDCAFLGSVSILGIYEGIRHLRAPSFTPEPLGPGAYLLILSVLLLLAVVAEAVVRPPVRVNKKNVGGSRIDLFHRNPVFQAFLGLIVYTILLQYVGYFLSTLCFMIGCIWIFGERRWLWVIISGGGLALVFYVLFKKLAGVPVP